MLLILGVLMAGVWLASAKWSVSWTSGASRISISRGVLSVWRPATGPAKVWKEGLRFFAFTEMQKPEMWGLNAEASKQPLTQEADLGVFAFADVAGSREWRLALWPVAFLLCTAGGLLLRSGIIARRRASANRCTGCGYDLAGLPPSPDAKCPECGKA